MQSRERRSSPPSFPALPLRGGRCEFPSRPPPQSRPRQREDWKLSPQLPLQRVSLLDAVGVYVRDLDGHRPRQADRGHPSTDIGGLGPSDLAGVQVCRCAGVHACKRASVQACKRASVQVTCTTMIYSLSPFLTVWPDRFFSSSSLRSSWMRDFSEI